MAQRETAELVFSFGIFTHIDRAESSGLDCSFRCE